MSYAILEWMLIGMLAVTVLFAGVILIREVWRRLLQRRLKQDSRSCRELIETYQKEHFSEINKLMFHLRDNFETEVVEHVLRDYIQQGDAATRGHIREIYRFFEFTDNYIRNLTSIRWRDRAEAAFILGMLGDARAVPHLIARMQDPDEDTQNVKMACAQALGMIKDPQAIEYLIRALEDVNQWSSVKVAEMLVHFGETAVPTLLKALANDTNTNQRIWAAQILGAIGSSASVPMLIQRLRDRDANVRIATVEALGRLKSPLAVHAIIELLLRDPVAEVRSQAAIALGTIADEAALSPLINALNDPEYWTRVRAVEALERLGSNHTPHLTRLLFFDPRQEVRRRAAQALERLGVIEEKVSELGSDNATIAAEAKQLLLAVARQGQTQRIQSFLADPDLRVRTRICEIMGESGDPSAEPALLLAAQDSSWVVRIKAIDYLARHPTDATAQVLQQALTESDDLRRPLIVEALKKLNRSQLDHFFPQLLMLIHDDNIEVRKNAVDLLSHFAVPETQSALAGSLQDPVVEIRLAAVESLGRIGSKQATPVLVKALTDPDTFVRLRCAYFLGQFRDERAVDGLLRALEDADDRERRGIAEALSQFGLDVIYERLDELMGAESVALKVGVCWVLGATQDSRAIRLLSFFLQDSYIQVRCAAIGSLSRISAPQIPALLAPSVHDVNKKVRASIANAFLRLGDAGDELHRLAELLEDPDDFVRCRAALAVGRTAPAGVMEQRLISLFEKTTDRDFRLSLLLGIGLIPSTQSFQYVLPFFHQNDRRQELLEMLEREEQPVQQRLFANLKLEHLDDTTRPEEILEHYIKELQQSQDVDKRAAAVNALEVLAIPEVIPYLLDSLSSDPEAQIRQQTTRALHNLTEKNPDLQPRVQTALLKATSDPVADVCQAALEALIGIADSEANPRLFELLNARNRFIQKAAATLLSDIHQHDVQPLIELIEQSQDEDQQRRAIFAMRKVEDPQVIGYLKKVLQDPSRGLRAAAVRALQGHLDHPETRELLGNVLRDPAGEVRYWTLHALAEYEDPALLPLLLTTTQDPDPRVRIELLQALARIRQLPTLEAITHMLEDPIEQVRQQGYLSLLQLSSRESLGCFLQYFPQTPVAFREQLQSMIAQQNVMEFPRHALQTAPDPEQRLLALKAIALFDQDTHQDLYVMALKDPSALVRREATRHLLNSSQEMSASILQQLAHDPDPHIQHMLHAERST